MGGNELAWKENIQVEDKYFNFKLDMGGHKLIFF